MSCKKFFLCSVLVILTLAYLPGLPPYLDFPQYKLKPILPEEGPLARNNYLDYSERLYENYLIGPESIAVGPNNEIYVGLVNSDIVKIWGKDFEKSKFIANNGPPGCSTLMPHDHLKCGRPAGLRYIPSGHLIIADISMGILKLDVNTGKDEVIVPSSLIINGTKLSMNNGVDIDKKGNIYWTDSSTTSSFEEMFYEMFAGPSGRLIKYDSATKECMVLISKLHLGNGVQLSPDEDFVLVAETFQRRVLRYWLKGSKKGTYDIFVDGLPGMADNIKPTPNGGYFVTLVAPENRNMPDAYQFIGEYPALRRIFVRFIYLIDAFLNAISFSSFNVKEAIHCGIQNSASKMNLSYVIELDSFGKIVSSLQGYSGILNQLSEKQYVGNNLLFGSAFSPYLGKLNLVKLKEIENYDHKLETSPHKTEL